MWVAVCRVTHLPDLDDCLRLEKGHHGLLGVPAALNPTPLAVPAAHPGTQNLLLKMNNGQLGHIQTLNPKPYPKPWQMGLQRRRFQ